MVEPKGKTVSISGGVNVPGIYELKDKETLEDLINLAKGMKPGTQDSIESMLGIQMQLKSLMEERIL